MSCLSTSPPLQSELLLKSVLGINPKTPSIITNDSDARGVADTVSKTDFLKQQLGKMEAKKIVEKSVNVSPPKAKGTSSKNNARNSSRKASRPVSSSESSDKIVANAKVTSSSSSSKVERFAGSAFVNSPHPDNIPLPDFEDNFFDS